MENGKKANIRDFAESLEKTDSEDEDAAIYNTTK